MHRGSFVNYCLDCEWSASTDRHPRSELSALAIDHGCSTGHEITGERFDGRSRSRVIREGRREARAAGTDGPAGEHSYTRIDFETELAALVRRGRRANVLSDGNCGVHVSDETGGLVVSIDERRG